MARTLIWNTSATAQTLPVAYGGGAVQPGYGWIVSDESSVVVTALGGFADMHGKWAVAAISTDEALGSVDMNAAGVALVADVVSTITGGGGGGGGPVAWADILNKPGFATVATSGSYSDLSDVPVLSAVGTSGQYSDLIGSPAIPVASNVAPSDVAATAAAGVLGTYARGDHQHAHGNQAGGALHSAATTISAGFMSAADKSKLDGLATVASSGEYADLLNKPALAAVATSGNYNDLSNKPTLAVVANSGLYDDLLETPSLAAVALSGSYTDLSGTPALATVATSGSYSDLSGKPALAAVATSGSYADLSNKPTKTYDIGSFASGSLSLSAVTMKFYAPKNLTLTALNQGGGATVKIQVDAADITYPKSVTAGQVITTVVTVAGVDNYFTISAVEA